MTYIDKRLYTASTKSNYKIVISVGESFTGTYLRWEEKVDEKYNKLRYRFFFKLTDGTEKYLQCGAKPFLGAMSKVAPGTSLLVTKTAEGIKTNYDIEVIKAAKSAAQVEDDEVVEEPDAVEEEGEEEDGEPTIAPF